jgi:hypothetical protein
MQLITKIRWAIALLTHLIFVQTVYAAYALPFPTLPVHKTFSVYTATCNPDMIRQAVGPAVINVHWANYLECGCIECANPSNIYKVTIDINQMNYCDLIRKLRERGCITEGCRSCF